MPGMLPRRSEATLTRFFREQWAAWRKGVEAADADGSTHYKIAIEQYLPRTQHILGPLPLHPLVRPLPGNPPCQITHPKPSVPYETFGAKPPGPATAVLLRLRAQVCG